MIEIAMVIFVFATIALFFMLAGMVMAMKRLQRTVDRLEHTGGQLATMLARMEGATVVVADNLADSVSRADATHGPEGAAADAALRTGDSAEAIHQRQDDARG